MAYIKVIEHENSTGELKGIYDYLVAARGKLADVHKIQSLNPPTVLSHMNLYKDIMFGQSPLKRYQREMIAVVVSASNKCEYCMQHHREALNHFWKDNNRIEKLIAHQDDKDLSAIDKALCAFGRGITTQPEMGSAATVESLRQAGLDDRAILDATLVASYFNFVNRIVLTLGLEINESEVTGYNY